MRTLLTCGSCSNGNDGPNGCIECGLQREAALRSIDTAKSKGEHAAALGVRLGVIRVNISDEQACDAERQGVRADTRST
jgi:hypothetical protein